MSIKINIVFSLLQVFSKNDDVDFPEDIEDILDVFDDIQKELRREGISCENIRITFME